MKVPFALLARPAYLFSSFQVLGSEMNSRSILVLLTQLWSETQGIPRYSALLAAIPLRFY